MLILLFPNPVQILFILTLKYHVNLVSLYCLGSHLCHFSLEHLHWLPNWLPYVRCQVSASTQPDFFIRIHFLKQFWLSLPCTKMSLGCLPIEFWDSSKLSCMGSKAFHNLSLQIYIQLPFCSLRSNHIVFYFQIRSCTFKLPALFRLKPRFGIPFPPAFLLGKILFILRKPYIVCTPIEGWSSISHIIGHSLRYIFHLEFFEGKDSLFSYKACFLSSMPLMIVLN